MSDYLSNLVARTNQTTDVIQPRVAARFEPLPGQSALRAPVHDLSRSVVEEQREVDAAQRATSLPATSQLPGEQAISPAQPVAHAAHPAQSQPPSRHKPAPTIERANDHSNVESELSSAFATLQRQLRALQAERSIAPVPTEREQSSLVSAQVDNSASPTRQARSAQPKEAANEQLIQPRSRQTQRGDAPTMSSVSRRPPELSPTPLERRIEIERRVETIRTVTNASAAKAEAPPSPATNHATPTVSLPQAKPAAHVLAQPHVKLFTPSPLARQEAQSNAQQLEREPPVPTIQVTIGRIEVRATPAATNGPARKTKPAAGSSLDAYLRARDGGKP